MNMTILNTAAIINPIVAGNGNSGVGVGPLDDGLPIVVELVEFSPGITITALSRAGDDVPVTFRTCVL